MHKIGELGFISPPTFRYHQGDLFRISDLQEEIYDFTMLKKLWLELENLRLFILILFTFQK